jgi:hypothetical protein
VKLGFHIGDRRGQQAVGDIAMGKRKQLDNLEKCTTSIKGLDDITEGVLPRGRTTLAPRRPGNGTLKITSERISRGHNHEAWQR